MVPAAYTGTLADTVESSMLIPIYEQVLGEDGPHRNITEEDIWALFDFCVILIRINGLRSEQISFSLTSLNNIVRVHYI